MITYSSFKLIIFGNIVNNTNALQYRWHEMYFHRKRRGAINSKQLTYLEKYRPKQRLRFKDPHNHKSKCCLMWSALSNRHWKKLLLTDWNYQSSAFELLLLLWRGIQPTLVYIWDPFTQGLYQLRAVKDEPLEFCLHTQTPIISVFTHLSWIHTKMLILTHTRATSYHTVPAAHSPKMIMAGHLLLRQCKQQWGERSISLYAIFLLLYETAWQPCSCSLSLYLSLS